MSDQKFFETQPSPLPEVLPVGTRTISGYDAALSVVKLRPACDKHAQGYWGTWGRYEDCYNTPRNIDWKSVPIPEPKPDLCECCGVRKATGTIRGDTDWSRGLTGVRYALPCIASPSHHTFRARRAALAAGTSTSAPAAASAGKGSVPPAVPEQGAPSGPSLPAADPYAAHRLKVDARIPPSAPSPAHAARLAAWERPERLPRNRADERMLALPHPWDEFDSEESR